jgi:hypothetical protein
MKFSEEQIRDIILMKDNLVKELEKHHNAIELLDKNIALLDSILKETSFTKASTLSKTRNSDIPKKDSTQIYEKYVENSIPIKKNTDGTVIANAYVTPDQVSIVMEEKIGLNIDTPPFKSFFLDRIIGEMKRKDSMEVEEGKIQKESVIDYIINKNGSDIREIIIKNYRQKDRVNEIINTAGWSFVRMLENLRK